MIDKPLAIFKHQRLIRVNPARHKAFVSGSAVGENLHHLRIRTTCISCEGVADDGDQAPRQVRRLFPLQKEGGQVAKLIGHLAKPLHPLAGLVNHCGIKARICSELEGCRQNATFRPSRGGVELMVADKARPHGGIRRLAVEPARVFDNMPVG